MTVIKKERKAGIGLFSALMLAALVFTGCPTDTSDPEPVLDWGDTATWDGTDATAVLGTASAAISGTDIRYKETPLGNLIADGIAEYARYTSGETVDFAMLNGQNVQGLTEIPKGDITLNSLSAGLSDSLFLVTYTGKDIEDLINIFVNSTAYESGNPGWKRNCVVLVSSGVSYTVTPDTDPTKPPKATNIKVNGATIDPNNTEKTYRVAVGNFMAGQNATTPGGDATSGGGSNFVSYGSAKRSYHPVTLKEAVARYILAKGTLNPVLEGRISGTVPKLPGDPEPDPDLDWGKIATWDESDTTAVLGTASAAISGTDIRYKETPLGNLIADGIAEYARYTSGETVDFAMLNGQNVQGLTEIPKGDITLNSLSAGLGDSLFLVTYTGKDIEDLINIFVNSTAYESGNPGWKRNCVVLVSSGVSYTVTPDTDPTKPPKATNIKVNGATIDPNNTEKTYRVAVGNFMAGQNATTPGGDATSGGGSNFVSYGSAKQSYHPVTLKGAVARYILAKGTLNPVLEGRISGTVPVKLPAE